jgi:hypothetical protein
MPITKEQYLAVWEKQKNNGSITLTMHDPWYWGDGDPMFIQLGFEVDDDTCMPLKPYPKEYTDEDVAEMMTDEYQNHFHATLSFGGELFSQPTDEGFYITDEIFDPETGENTEDKEFIKFFDIKSIE